MDLSSTISLRTSIQIFSLAFILGLLTCFSFIMAQKWLKNSLLYSCCCFYSGKKSNKVSNEQQQQQRHQRRRVLPVRNVNSRTSSREEGDENKSDGSRPAGRASVASVQAKYMMNVERGDPIFTNYLHKSDKPFLGYVSVKPSPSTITTICEESTTNKPKPRSSSYLY